MALRFSQTGVAVYGRGTVAVDGSTPAALTGTVGPSAWKSTGVLVYQDGGTGGGPWTLKQLTLPATIANIDSSPASLVAGGGGEWAVWEPATGLRTSIAIGPFAASFLGDVSPDGELVRIEYLASRSGLIVYDNSGGILYQDSTVVLNSTQVCLRDSILSYYDGTGWHLRDIENDVTPSWYPRTDGVTELVPVTHRGTLYVLEKSPLGISLRRADTSQGWILSTDPNAFSLDGVSISANIVMAGVCNVPSEAPSSLVVFRCTVTKAATISVQTGTIVTGAISYGTAQSVGTSPFTVGPQEGNSLTAPNLHLPVNQQLANPDRQFKMDQDWVRAFRAILNNVSESGAVVQKLPTPNLASGGYDKIASTGQPTMMALPGQTTLSVESASTSRLTVTLNPATNTVTLDALGVSYVPVSTGAEPLVIVSNGAGAVLLTPYTP